MNPIPEPMLSTFRAELHVHTVLSPCAAVEMIPPLIVQTALKHGIQLIAITDHNTSANVTAVQQAARGTGLAVLPGMEFQTREEVHLLCLFDRLQALQRWQSIVDDSLPRLENKPAFFGKQFVVDETGAIIRHEPRMLIVSSSLSLNEAYWGVTELGGLAIPAHVNRKAYGLIANLGLVPENLPFEALEISASLPAQDACRELPQLCGYTLIQNGDVHHLDDFFGATEFRIQAPTIAELRLALRGQDGRSVVIRERNHNIHNDSLR